MRKKRWLMLPLLLAGCDRAWYRRDADRDAYSLTRSHIVCPENDVGRTRVEPAPESRLADPDDPDDPDHPRRPPDDPIARLFMNCPGGMRGGKRWDRDGVSDSIESPAWQCLLNLDEKGKLRLDPDRAMELALLNSREYQTQIETLYSTALNLSLARFQFAPQFLARQGTTFTHFGAGGFINGESNLLTVTQEAGFTKALAAGGNILVDLANSFVWEFSNGGARLVTTNLLMRLAQPLLRNAGREFTLEPLTQSERDLLYQVRTFARFRKQFWADITTTNNGYLNLLLGVQAIRNAQSNLKSQEQTYRLHLELFNGGKVSGVQVDQVLRDFLNARLGVAQSQAALDASLDDFKLRLGLPPRLPVDLDDSRLSQFDLSDKPLDDLRESVVQYQLARLQELNKLPSVESLRRSLGELRALVKRTPEQFAREAKKLDEGFKQLDRPPQPGQDAEQVQRLRQVYERSRQVMAQINKGLTEMPDKLNADETSLTEENRKKTWEQIHVYTSDLLGHLDGLIAIETVLRINSIELPTLDEGEDAAIEYAKEHRLDLMNAKAAVTDAWRRVRVAANQLRGELNLIGSATLGANPLNGNPFGFSLAQSRYTVGLNVEAPLNRLAERNVYRQSLIDYQQARRAYMALADRIEQQVRRDLRQLSIQRLSFEISRQSLVSAARQLEAARTRILIEKDSTGTTTTRDILDALRSLLDARNALAQSYIGYEQLRVQLLLDLERLQLDSRGFPIDEHVISPAGPAARPGAEPLPPQGE